MAVTFLYFVALIGPLITIHELGHFIVAKLTGVRVLTFSLGFGPRLFGVKIGDTDYRVSALPLGGYVRMYGDESAPDVPENERHYAFLDKPWWVKVAIALAGPAANLLLPLVIFFGLHLGTQPVVEPVIGTVLAGEAGDVGGIKAGDRIVAIDGHAVARFDDLVELVSPRANQPTKIDVVRGAEKLTLTATPAPSPSGDPLDTTPVGRLGLAPSRALAVVSVENGSVADKAGVKGGDRVVSVDGVVVDDRAALFAALDGKDAAADVVLVVERVTPKTEKDPEKKETLTLTLPKEAKNQLLQTPPSTSEPAHKLCEIGSEGCPPEEPPPVPVPVTPPEPEIKSMRFAVLSGELAGPLAKTVDATRALVVAALADTDRRRGLAPWEGTVSQVLDKSPAAVHGLRKGKDRVVAVDGKPLRLASDVATALGKDVDGIHVIGLVDDDGNGATFALRLQRSADRAAGGRKIAGFGVDTRLGGAVVSNEDVGVVEAARRAVASTGETIVLIAKGFQALATGKVGLDQLGGPVMIADVASQAADDGLATFLQVMCLVSVNLGLLNLLPVPVLDGGHIVIVTFEAVRRKKLTVAARNRVTQIGLALVGLLMLVAMFNDVSSLFGPK